MSDYEERPIILACRADHRSIQAVQLLTRQGFADVLIAKGGMTKWNDDGFQVER